MGDSEKIIAQLNDPTQVRENFDIDADQILESSFIQQILDFEKQYLKNNHSLALKDVRKKALGIVEKEVISSVLEKTGGNKSKASRILGVSYKTLLSKIKELDIS
jgi:DNA-binding protein Fis